MTNTSLTANEPVLRLDGISKSFPGSIALQDASLHARSGEAHALMGANGAGKSTLVNILGGIVTRDSGSIAIDGRAVDIRGPRDAAALGIAFVHQELAMLPAMSVAENVFIDRLPVRGPFTDRAAASRQASALLQRLGCSLPADMPVEALSTGDRQMVEIARAIKSDPRIVIFDEPTSSLTEREKTRLFDTIELLKRSGAVVLYITHFVDEIFRICDRVTIVRDGRTVGSGPIAEFSQAEVVRLMIGEAAGQERLSPPAEQRGKPVLEVRGLRRAGSLQEIDLTMHQGEVVGLWGLLGSGRTELVRALVGLDPIDGGQFTLHQNAERHSVSPEAIHRVSGFVTEDRRGEGLLLPLSIDRNVSLASLRRLLRPFGLIDRAREKRLAVTMVDRLRIKATSLGQQVSTLSGGNQQKVVLGRWLATQPALFFLDEPTRGLDVGAKAEMLRLAADAARAGASVLLISSELAELMRVCDRYLVMDAGAIVAEFPGTATRDELLAAIAGEDRGAVA